MQLEKSIIKLKIYLIMIKILKQKNITFKNDNYGNPQLLQQCDSIKNIQYMSKNIQI
jgi:predicted DNA-binding protein (MmcQ/YjbR family)